MSITLHPPTLGRPAAGTAGDLQREIMRCRRRQSSASVLVARLDADHRLAPRELLDWFRLTDSVTVARIGRALEVIGVFDDEGLEREGLQRRLLGAFRGMRVTLAWAGFPDDGVTLEALVDRARSELA
jgi:hypothetical protein